MFRKIIKLRGSNNLNVFKTCNSFIFHASERHIHDLEDFCDDQTKHSKKVNEILGKYSEQETEKILQIVNNVAIKDLLSYDISKMRANKLVAHRTSKGLLKQLTDIFSVEGFGLKMTDKFFQSLLEQPKTQDLNKKQTAKTAPFITPSMETELRQNINSCIAVRIGVNSITWSKLNLSSEHSPCPCQLSHWQHHEISEKKLHLSELIQRCLYVSHHIPQADCYLFENPQMAQANNNPGSVEQQNINIQKSQVTAMMGYALASRNAFKPRKTEENIGTIAAHGPMVFYVRRFLTARLFNHLVGTERVSSEDTILELMRTHYNLEDMDEDLLTEANKTKQQVETGQAHNIKGNVYFPMEFREMFSKAPRYHREFLGQALLLNLTFVRLVLLQDPKSIALVSRSGRNKGDPNSDSD